MKFLEGFACRLAVALSVTFGSAFAWSQDYPFRPIRVIVPFAAGGATDLLARELGRDLTERRHQPVIVDNRPGAGGIIGLDIGAKLPYDPIKSFTPITEIEIPVRALG